MVVVGRLLVEGAPDLRQVSDPERRRDSIPVDHGRQVQHWVQGAEARSQECDTG